MNNLIKNIFYLLLISVIGSIVVSFSEAVIPLLILLLLIIFPGKEEKPRLLRFIPYFWIYSIFEASLISIDYIFNLKLFPNEIYALIKMPEIIFVLVTSPILTFIYFKKQIHLLKAITVASIISILISIYLLSNSEINAKSIIDFIAGIISDLIMIFYFRKILSNTT